MELTELIREQSFQVFVMFCAGMFLAVCYTFFDVVIKKSKIVLRTLAELLFWIISSRLIFEFIYYCSYGKLNFYLFATMTFGYLLFMAIKKASLKTKS